MSHSAPTLALLLPAEAYDLMRRIETMRLRFPPRPLPAGEPPHEFRERYRREADALARAEAQLASLVLAAASLDSRDPRPKA